MSCPSVYPKIFGMDPKFTNQNYTYLFIWLLTPEHYCLCALRCSWDRFLKFYLPKWSKNSNFVQKLWDISPFEINKNLFQNIKCFTQSTSFHLVQSKTKMLLLYFESFTLLFNWLVMKQWALDFWTKCFGFSATVLMSQPRKKPVGTSLIP